LVVRTPARLSGIGNILGLVAGCVLATLFAGVAGLANIQVYPSIVRPVVRAGGSVDFPVVVTNGDSVPRQFEVTVHNMTDAPEGFPLAAGEDEPRGCAQWLSVSPTSFTLNPGRTQAVRCQLQVPWGKSGGYYAMIMIESRSPRPLGGLGRRSGAVQMSQAFGTAILAVVPGRGLSVRLRPAGILLRPAVGAHGIRRGWVVDALVRNEGTIHAKVRGEAEMRALDRGTIARLPLEGGAGTVLAGAVRKYSGGAGDHLSDGVYVLTARFSVPGTRIQSTQSQAFAVESNRARAVQPDDDLKTLMDSLLPVVGLSPEDISVSCAPGSRASSVLRLSTTSQKPLDLRVHLSDWQLSPEGEEEFPDDRCDHGRSAVAWLSLNHDRLTLAPRARTGLRVTAAVPRDTSPGDYFAALRLRDPAAPPGLFYPSYATVRVTVGRDGAVSCQIKDSRINAPNTPAASATVDLLNAGDVTLWPIVTLSVSDAEGKTVLPPTRLAAGEYAVLPRQVRQFTVPLDLVLRPGRYTATVTATARESADAVSDTVSFEAHPWHEATTGKRDSSPTTTAR